jgi:uncharacterized protein (TIGR02265 family)
MSDIRGLIIQSRMDYIENHFDNSYAQVLKKLSEPVRHAIGEQVFLTNLYPFHLLRDLDAAIGESLPESLESIFSEIGQRYADLILDRYFYNYLEERNPHKFLEQLEKLYPYLWNFGQYSYKKSDNTEARIQFDYNEDVHKPYCWFVQYFLKRGIEICGGNSVEVQELKCEAEGEESCIYQIRWNL